MIGQRYREKKIAVLDVWNRYQSIRGNNEDGVDHAFLDQRVKALKEGRYVFVVVGETKAGKSTLINALLGERILPTDVLQSSSAVVEIFKSEEKFVSVKYADGHTEQISDDLDTPEIDEAFEHLRKIASIQDRFRTIPTSIIDGYILQGKMKPDGSLLIPELQEASGLPLSGKEDLIAEYVSGRTPANIPVEISFGFPLRFEFDELRLVDSPGVNALGGVQNYTFSYLHNANAVLFVHSLEGPVEKSSFRDFITHVVPNRARQTLFLVLTKSGLRSEIEINGKLDEARSLFSKEFDPHRVIHADSMLKIVSDEISRYDSAVALKQYYTEREKHYTDRYQAECRQEWRDDAVNFNTKLRLLNDTLETTGIEADRDIVASELQRRSNFNVLEEAIEEFSAKAPELQLSELLAAVRNGYENQLGEHEQAISLLKKKKKHPQTFENEISEIQKLLGEYQREMNEYSEIIHSRFTGVKAKNRTKLQLIKTKYEGIISKVMSDSDVRKALVDFNDESTRLVDQVASQVKDGFSEKLSHLGAEFKSKHGITPPRVDVASIVKQAKKDAYRTEKIKVGSDRDKSAAGGGVGGAILGGVIGFLIGGPVGAAIGAGAGAAGGAGVGHAVGDDIFEERKVFDDDKYIANLRSQATATVQKVAENTVPSILSKFVDNHTTTFKSAVEILISARRAALEEIRTKKASNDEILADISSEEGKKKEVQTQLIHVEEMLEDLR